jgi:hypothetical protein
VLWDRQRQKCKCSSCCWASIQRKLQKRHDMIFLYFQPAH